MTKPSARAHYERRESDRVYREVSDMFNSRRNPTPTVTPAASLSSVAAAGAPVSLEEQREALILAMEGPHALALDAVRDDSGLRDRLSDAVDQGMSVIDLSGVPRYRRAAAVETALDEWARGTLGGPCSVCGCNVARRGYQPHRSIDGEPPTPSFQNGKCDFCREALRIMDLDRLLRHVFSAKVGIRHFGDKGEGRFIATFAELKEQLPSVRPGEPWGYIPRAALTGILKAADFPRQAFVQNRREQLLHSFDGIVPPVHDPATLPPNPSHPGVEWPEREKRVKREAREWAEFQERSAKFRAGFKEQQTRSIDVVYPPEQAGMTPAQSAAARKSMVPGAALFVRPGLK